MHQHSLLLPLNLYLIASGQFLVHKMHSTWLPYYLFIGTLIECINRQVARLKIQYPQIEFAHSQYFGFEEEIYALLNERVLEASGDLDDI